MLVLLILLIFILLFNLILFLLLLLLLLNLSSSKVQPLSQNQSTSSYQFTSANNAVERKLNLEFLNPNFGGIRTGINEYYAKSAECVNIDGDNVVAVVNFFGQF